MHHALCHVWCVCVCLCGNVHMRQICLKKWSFNSGVDIHSVVQYCSAEREQWMFLSTLHLTTILLRVCHSRITVRLGQVWLCHNILTCRMISNTDLITVQQSAIYKGFYICNLIGFQRVKQTDFKFKECNCWSNIFVLQVLDSCSRCDLYQYRDDPWYSSLSPTHIHFKSVVQNGGACMS